MFDLDVIFQAIWYDVLQCLLVLLSKPCSAANTQAISLAEYCCCFTMLIWGSPSPASLHGPMLPFTIELTHAPYCCFPQVLPCCSLQAMVSTLNLWLLLMFLLHLRRFGDPLSPTSLHGPKLHTCFVLLLLFSAGLAVLLSPDTTSVGSCSARRHA